MGKRYLVTLTEGERADLGRQAASGRGSARELTHARILLKADRGPHGPAWADGAIAAALDVSRSTVERVRRRFAQGGLARIIHGVRWAEARTTEAPAVSGSCSLSTDGRCFDV